MSSAGTPIILLNAAFFNADHCGTRYPSNNRFHVASRAFKFVIREEKGKRNDL